MLAGRQAEIHAARDRKLMKRAGCVNNAGSGWREDASYNDLAR